MRHVLEDRLKAVSLVMLVVLTAISMCPPVQAQGLDAFMLGMDHQIWQNDQMGTTLGVPWTGWNGLSKAGDKGTSIVVVPDKDGRLHAFMIGPDNQIWHNDQTWVALGAAWTGWNVLSKAGDKGTSIVVVPNRDGRLHAFMIGLDNQIWHNDQTGTALGAAWTGWNVLSKAGDKGTSVVVAPNQDGRLHAFMIGLDNQIWHNDQTGTALGAAWTGWNVLSKAGDKGTSVVVAPNQDGRLHAFMIGLDNQIWHNDQTGNTLGAAWTGWNVLSKAGDKGTSVVVAPNQDGRLHAFMIGLDNQIWHNDQTGNTLGAAWTGWNVLSKAGDKGTSVVVAPNQDGRLHAFMIGLDNQIWHNDQTGNTLGAAWTGWNVLSKAGDKGTSVVVAPNQDGRLHAFMIGLDNQIWHNDQTGNTLGAAWTGWNVLSKAGDQGTQLVIARSKAPTGALGSFVPVTTYHYDNFRTGWNSNEGLLNYTNVTDSTFGLVVNPVALDDQVDAQPLIVPNQTISGQAGKHTVVYIATEGNTIYAIDAATGEILLSRNFGRPGLPVPKEYLARSRTPFPQSQGCPNNGPRVGINGTPVIDLASNTMYAITYTINVDSHGVPAAGSQAYHIHAIDLSSLADKLPPKLITASHTLTNGDTINFSAIHARQRAALLESSGKIYAGFGSFCDDESREADDLNHARGWVLGWDTELAPLAANQLNDRLAKAANQNDFFLSSVWMSGYGISADESGNLFFTTGNSDCTPDYPCAPGYTSTYDGVNNIQESVVKLKPDLSKNDLFTPSNVSQLDQEDNDLSSGGVMLLPSQAASVSHLGVTIGKDGRMFLLDRDSLGGYTAGGPDKVLDIHDVGACWCGPSYFADDAQAHIVSSGGSSVISWGLITSPSPSLTKQAAFTNMGPQQDGGFFTSVSSSGHSNLIIWAVSRPQDANPAYVRLYAFNPEATAGNGVLVTLLTSPPVAGHWDNTDANANIIPVVDGGRVFVASNRQLSIFGVHASSASTFPVASGAQLVSPPSTPGSGHQIYGTVLESSDSRVTIETRTGKLVRVDVSAIRIGPGSIRAGRRVQVMGDYDDKGVLHATMLYRAKPFPALWPADR